jgi:hypothetical protein
MLRMISRAKSGPGNNLVLSGKYSVSQGITNILSETNPMTQEFFGLREGRFIGIQVKVQ